MPMDFALAVYDALVAVNVPPDRARIALTVAGLLFR
jgi:hypothetical protein